MYDSIYVELADQYKLMDAASNVAKRNVVAGQLREVIDILEQKVCRPKYSIVQLADSVCRVTRLLRSMTS